MNPAPYPAPELVLPFLGGLFVFRLGLQQIAELETACGLPGRPLPIASLFAGVMDGRYVVEGRPAASLVRARFRLAWILEPIRQGLIGGGAGRLGGARLEVDRITAGDLVTLAMDLPLVEAWHVAAAVLRLLEGYPVAHAKPRKRREPAQPFDLAQAITNCALMGGIDPETAKRMTLWEYSGLLSRWQVANSSEGEGDVEPPGADKVRRHMAWLADSPLTRSRPETETGPPLEVEKPEAPPPEIG